MSLTKKILKSKPITKVTFRVPSEAAPSAEAVFLVGDFNEWSPRATPMSRLKNGEFKVTLDLETGRDYSFRYLIGGEKWENDWAADRYVPSGIAGAENSVVTA
jgi:1,4-alpha-glucan branching enzyme